MWCSVYSGMFVLCVVVVVFVLICVVYGCVVLIMRLMLVLCRYVVSLVVLLNLLMCML